MDAEAIKRSLEGSGLRCTPQRYAVMAFLMGHTGHPTAAEIFEGVNRLDPRSSRATTYNNLRDLVQAGLVREVAVEGRAARFDAKGLRHHHFICDRCGSVRTYSGKKCPNLPLNSSVISQRMVSAHSRAALAATPRLGLGATQTGGPIS